MPTQPNAEAHGPGGPPVTEPQLNLSTVSLFEMTKPTAHMRNRQGTEKPTLEQTEIIKGTKDNFQRTGNPEKGQLQKNKLLEIKQILLFQPLPKIKQVNKGIKDKAEATPVEQSKTQRLENRSKKSVHSML